MCGMKQSTCVSYAFHLLHSTFFIFIFLWVWCYYVLYCVLNAISVGVSLMNFVIFVSVQMYVKVAHFSFWCCRLMFPYCSCVVRYFLILFMLYWLLCSVFLWQILFFAYSVNGYVCNLFNRFIINTWCICSLGWYECWVLWCLCDVFSVYCEFWLCVLLVYCKIQEINGVISFLVANFILFSSSLNSIKALSTCVFLWLKITSVSSAYSSIQLFDV
jgi:hypothetical protein